MEGVGKGDSKVEGWENKIQKWRGGEKVFKKSRGVEKGDSRSERGGKGDSKRIVLKRTGRRFKKNTSTRKKTGVVLLL